MPSDPSRGGETPAKALKNRARTDAKIKMYYVVRFDELLPFPWLIWNIAQFFTSPQDLTREQQAVN
jgi:hypothetical protein